MKVTALKSFYADFFKSHVTKGETVEIQESKDPKKNNATKKMVTNYIQAGLLEKAPEGREVGKQDPKEGVKILKAAKKKADKLATERLKAQGARVGKTMTKAQQKVDKADKE